MSIDGITLHAITEELRDKLISGRIQKINQINDHSVIISIYAGKNYQLLISVNSQNPRIHLTDKNYKNPPRPSNFTMVLRKHLQGFRIKDIRQNKLDRTVIIEVLSYNELGDLAAKKLIVDIMGKYSNIILIDDKDIVIESLIRVSHEMSRVRTIYPGSKFSHLKDDKINILDDDRDFLDLDLADKTQVFRSFYQNFIGFSPVMGREICYRASIDPKLNYGSLNDQEKSSLNEAFLGIRDIIRQKKFRPNLIYVDGQIDDFYCLELQSKSSDLKFFDSMSEVLDSYFILKTNDDALNQMKKNLKDRLDKIVEKKVHKLDNIKNDYQKAKGYDSYRIEGDVLSTGVNKLEKGMDKVSLYNYYDDQYMEIKLNPKKSPWENIDAKYKTNKKLSKAYKILKKAIPRLRDEIEYLNDLSYQVDQVDDQAALDEIKDELEDQGYIKKKRFKKKKKKKDPSKPYQYKSSRGLTIMVGKNNRQNEILSLKTANKNDYFFHIKDLPGAHVILRNDSDDIEDVDLLDAAYLAGKHSKYSKEHYVDVDYTKVQNVSKIKNSKPGMVYYKNFKTIRVDLREKRDIKRQN